MILGDMLPRFTPIDIANRGTSNTKSSRKISCSVPIAFHGANLSNVIFGQFGRWPQFPSLVMVSSFVGSVSVVFALSADKQVIGVDAPPVIAPMKNAHAFRDGAVVELETQSMRKNRPDLWMADYPIPRGRTDRITPLPATRASVGSVYLSNEFENERTVVDNGHVSILNMLATPSAALTARGLSDALIIPDFVDFMGFSA